MELSKFSLSLPFSYSLVSALCRCKIEFGFFDWFPQAPYVTHLCVAEDLERQTNFIDRLPKHLIFVIGQSSPLMFLGYLTIGDCLLANFSNMCQAWDSAHFSSPHLVATQPRQLELKVCMCGRCSMVCECGEL